MFDRRKSKAVGFEHLTTRSGHGARGTLAGSKYVRRTPVRTDTEDLLGSHEVLGRAPTCCWLEVLDGSNYVHTYSMYPYVRK